MQKKMNSFKMNYLMSQSTSDQKGSHFLEKLVGREVAWDKNTEEGVRDHKERTKSTIRFRFPPEPNGALHLGHAKSMNLNFGIINHLKKEGINASCYLRFDDTNPEKESTEFTEIIIETVHWLGWQPDAITYSSDYFQQLYEFACQLIGKGLAYVDFSTSEEIAEQRRLKTASPYRDLVDSEGTLQLFLNMKNGVYTEALPTLRLKIDITSDNPNMWDPVAYRVKAVPHHRTGDQWIIYPSYDFSHCLVDSLEDIDYSLCTLEFETRREPYYWILDQLGLYKPRVWEFSRLNIERSTLSKRTINTFIQNGQVESCSDPRLLTLLGMRRKGYTPEAINAFCETIGLTRNENELQLSLLETALKDSLNRLAPRRFAVLRPLEVEIINYSEAHTFQAKNHPARPELGIRDLLFDNKTIYIESTDFRLKDSKDFYGLAPPMVPEGVGKTVGLKYGPNITYHSHLVDEEGQPTKVYCTVDYEKKIKPKTHVHWLVKDHTKSVNIVLLENLLDVEGNVNPDSWIALNDSLVEDSMNTVDDHEVYQFERQGYFVVDREASGVYLQTLSLKGVTRSG